MAASDPRQQEAKLHCFLQWLQANGAELRGCSIRYCGPDKGFGVFTTTGNNGDGNHLHFPFAPREFSRKTLFTLNLERLVGVVMVVPLDLAITPMRVLQDQLVGPRCRALFEEGDVDDRFLMMIFLMVERMLPNSVWKP
ncbi:hypothetical protein GW17_00014758 [Ensete ventricosum]|nr:hypothetical protein GW17_00014758 [Ensete ventricosum]